MVIKKENAAADMRDLTTAGTNGGKSTYPQADYTTFVALVEDHLETVKELERYRTKFDLLRDYLKHHYVDDLMVRVIAGDLE